MLSGNEIRFAFGHVVSKSGLKVDLDKVKAILALTAPRMFGKFEDFWGVWDTIEGL